MLATSGSLARLLENPKAGGFAALGVVLLGAALMVANIERGDADAPVAEAQTEAPVAPTTPVARVAVTPVAPPANTVAVASSTPVALAAPQPEKTTVRVDTSSTGAIAQDSSTKPKHKTHPKKQKLVDNEN
jgi:hypothetical protein